jgi:hypothetical protein
MFRNEGPISFNTDGQYFITQPGPAGDRDERLL